MIDTVNIGGFDIHRTTLNVQPMGSPNAPSWHITAHDDFHWWKNLTVKDAANLMEIVDAANDDAVSEEVRKMMSTIG